MSPAKLNLVLKIAPPTKDGFHPLESLMVKLDWGDQILLRLKLSSNLKLDIDGGLPLISAEKNICWKAATLFSEEFKTKFEAVIKIKKNIPMQAGLGGGSSNAAAVLRALAHWRFGRRASESKIQKRLHRMAAQLGSDLNVFLSEGNAAWCTGRGEIVEPKRIPVRDVVLVFPKTQIPTPWAYRSLDDFRRGSNFEGFDGYSKDWENSDRMPELKNDFQPVMLAKFGELRDIMRDLCESGAVAGQMTGSGSCFFALYRSRAEAAKGASYLRSKKRRLQVCRFSKG